MIDRPPSRVPTRAALLAARAVSTEGRARATIAHSQTQIQESNTAVTSLNSNKMKSDSEATFPDEMISQFLAFTGSADSDVAKVYLEMSGGDLETAVGLFMEHQNSGPSMASSSGVQHTAAEENTMNTSSRRSRTANRSHRNWVDEDGVRAPDQSQRMRLLDFDDAHDDDDDDEENGMPANRVTEMLMRSQAAMMMQGHFPPELLSSAFASDTSIYPGARTTTLDMRDVINRAATAGGAMHNVSTASYNPRNQRPYYHDNDEDDDVQILDQHDDDETEDDDDEVQVVGPSPPTAAATAPQRLSDMFSPPLSLIYMGPGGFQGARNTAKDSKRWLLVNLQRDSDFACHALNRDVWRDELVDNLIREGFIFWQTFDTTPEGHTYADRYNVTSYPHVGIIDPRTGRLVLRREGWTQMNPMTAAAFSELAADFCSRHSFDNPPLAPQLHGTAFGSHPSTSRPGKRPVNEMTEEEQLEAALQASRNEMEEDDLPVQTKDTGDNDQSQDAVPADNMEDIKDNSSDSNLKSAESSWEQEIAGMDVGDEPTINDGVARIMFRMPDGKKLVRKFYLTDPVKKVYGYVAQSNDDATKGKPFELKVGYPPKDLLSLVDNTIENAGLSGETVHVRWRTL